MRKSLIQKAPALLTLGIYTAPAVALPPSISPPGYTASQISNLAKPNPAFTVRPFGRTQDVSAISNRTLTLIATMPAPFSYCRLQYSNGSTSTKVIDAVTMQATAEAFPDATAQTVIGIDVALPGTGYAIAAGVGDVITLTIPGATQATAATVTVAKTTAADGVSAGGIAAVVVSNPGAFSVLPSGVTATQASTTGTGTGATFTVRAIRNGPGTFAPKDSSGNALSYLPVYFNAGGADSDPASTSGTTASITIPAGSVANPLPVWSDWTQVTSYPRNDGGSGYYLVAKTFISGSYSVESKADAYTWDDPANNHGQVWATYDAGNNSTTSTTSTYLQGARFAVNAIQCIGEKPVVTVMACGDSITQGHDKVFATSPQNLELTSGYESWGLIAAATVSTPTKPVAWYSSGWTAQTTAQYFARCMIDIARIKPQIVFLSPFSPNDGAPTSQAAAQAGFGLAVSAANKVIVNGGVPLFWTPTASAGKTTGAQDDPRLWVVNKVKTSGYYFFDYDAMTTNGAYPATLSAACDSGDGLHPNHTCRVRAATGWQNGAIRYQGAADLLQQAIGN